jgi:hypothetical protein
MHEPYSIVQYPGEPVITVTLRGAFSVASHLSSLNEEVQRVLDATQPVFYIVEVCDLKVTFEDLVVGSSTSARGAGAILHHPNIRELIVVTTDRLITLGVRGLQSPAFGLDRVSVFETLEDAMTHCREKIATTSK